MRRRIPRRRPGIMPSRSHRRIPAEDPDAMVSMVCYGVIVAWIERLLRTNNERRES